MRSSRRKPHTLPIVAACLAACLAAAFFVLFLARVRQQRRAEAFAVQTKIHMEAISLTAFDDSFHHARYLYEDELPPWELYEPEQILGIAENMVYLQNPDGGWPKNLDYQRVYTLEELEMLARAARDVPPVTYMPSGDPRASTLDNRNILFAGAVSLPCGSTASGIRAGSGSCSGSESCSGSGR